MPHSAAVQRLALALAASGLAGCSPVGPSARSLHVVDGTVVHSRPPAPQTYEAYLRARLALDADPPAPDVALTHLRRAIRRDPRDPHLWATRAQAEAMQGDVEQARSSAERALTLRPGYAPAQRVLATLPDSGAGGVQAASG